MDNSITGREVLKAVRDEKAESSQLTKTQRQQRRHELSNPSNISRRLTSVLGDRFPPERIAAQLEELLVATTIDRYGNERPDMRAREAGLKLVLNYTVGVPVTRSEHVEVKVEATQDQAQALIAGSRSLRAQLTKMMNGGA